MRQLEALRKKMRELDIDVFVVSDKDEHLSEYTGAHFEALREFSGFTGGDGILAVTESEAALWTDGRYFSQAEKELDQNEVKLMRMGVAGTPELSDWISLKLPVSGRLGFDGRCTSYDEGIKYTEAAAKKNAGYVSADVCGMVWENRPGEEFKPCWILDEKYCGESAENKLKAVREEMKRAGAAAHLIASNDDIAWLTNLRGGDVPFNPVFMAYMILKLDSAFLYVDPAHLTPEVSEYLDSKGIRVKGYHDVFSDLRSAGGAVMLDKKRVSFDLVRAVPGTLKIIDRMNPARASKCRKNETEAENLRNAQRKDAAAVTKFMHWFKTEGLDKVARGEKLTEWDCVLKLHEFRSRGKGFLYESFPTISAYGENAAMAHYMPSPDNSAVIKAKGLYLVDSGAQYMDGTTDITRTWSCGEITKEEREAFTLTVIANMRLANEKFLSGCSGVILDWTAREPFWERGKNYNHGTGHGVGFVLNVHEDPVRIRFRNPASEPDFPMREGMYVSDEPGYYEDGSFGVRTENLLLTRKDYTDEYGDFLKFETMTFVPIDTSCLDVSLMTDKDRRLLNEYHSRVIKELSGELTKEESAWLREICEEI